MEYKANCNGATVVLIGTIACMHKQKQLQQATNKNYNNNGNKKQTNDGMMTGNN